MYSNNSYTVLTYFHGQDSPKDKIEEMKRLMRFNYAILRETRVTEKVAGLKVEQA